MPVQDLGTGGATIWFISCLLFISIAVGGGFLLVYVISPESETTNWLPIAGVALVCLPWMFWLCTCMYRVISRLFGFRMAIAIGSGAGGGGDGGGGGKGGGLSRRGSVSNSTRGRTKDTNNNNNAKSWGTNDNGENGPEGKEPRTSFASHESEMPLATSMAP